MDDELLAVSFHPMDSFVLHDGDRLLRLSDARRITAELRAANETLRARVRQQNMLISATAKFLSVREGAEEGSLKEIGDEVLRIIYAGEADSDE